MTGSKIKFYIREFLAVRNGTRDFYLGLILLAFSLALLVWLIPHHVSGSSGQVGHTLSPRFFPYCVSVALGLLSLMLILVSPSTSKDVTRWEEKRLTPISALWIPLFLGYYFGVQFLGLVPASVAALTLLMRMYGFRRVFLSLLFSAGIVAVLFVFFEIMARIPVPRGILFGEWL